MRKRYKVGDKIVLKSGEVLTLGPDIDLDKERVVLKDGTRLTNKRVDEIIEEIHNRDFKNNLNGERS